MSAKAATSEIDDEIEIEQPGVASDQISSELEGIQLDKDDLQVEFDRKSEEFEVSLRKEG